MKLTQKAFLLLALFVGLLVACEPKDELFGPISPSPITGRLDSIPYNPTAYTFPVINGLPAMDIPANNPMTLEGIKLGRYLFYEKMLSVDNSISCASCHQQDKAFTDGQPVGLGVGGTPGVRNSMTLINVGYNWNPSRPNNFLWDGKFFNLEDQVLAPIEHPLEMMNNWDTVVVRLKKHPHYPRLFRKAFGIENISQISKELAAKALAQFLRTLNSANSEYDKHEWVPFVYMSDAAIRGRDLFLGDAVGGPVGKDAECAHCHSFTRNRALFARNGYSNNGLDSAQTLNDFYDKGFGGVTNVAFDNGKFREVTLRNIGLTAPYMHDGRFATLEEVLNHYVSGGHPSPNVSNELTTAPSLHSLTNAEKQDIIAFLNALTDTSYFNKAEWSDPFLLADPWAE